MRKSVVVLVTLAVSIALGSVALAGQGGPPPQANVWYLEEKGAPACLPGNALENDDVKIWFQGLKAHIKVFEKDENGTHQVYSYQTLAVTESNENGSLAWINLERAHPQTSDCSIEENDEWLNVTFSVTENVKQVGGPFIDDATVTFAYHFNKSSNGAKFDLFVDDWPWQADDSELAFDFSVSSPYEIESAENGIGFRDGTDSKGFIEWAPNATAVYEDEHEETAIVDSNTTVNGGTAFVRLAFTNVTAGYVHLDYDPWVGVGDYIILAGVLIPLGIVEPLLPEPARPIYEIISDLI